MSEFKYDAHTFQLDSHLSGNEEAHNQRDSPPMFDCVCLFSISINKAEKRFICATRPIFFRMLLICFDMSNATSARVQPASFFPVRARKRVDEGRKPGLMLQIRDGSPQIGRHALRSAPAALRVAMRDTTPDSAIAAQNVSGKIRLQRWP